MGLKLSNLAATTLAAGIAPAATSITVATGAGASFPSLGTNDYFYATLANSSGTEIVKVTARATDTLTVVRAQEGTTAKTFNAGDAVELRLTAQGMQEYVANPSQNPVTGSYTLVATDNGKTVYKPNTDTTAGSTWTIPANTSVPFPVGTTIQGRIHPSAASTALAITTDTLRLAGSNSAGSRTLAPGAFFTLYKETATEWVITGSGVS